VKIHPRHHGHHQIAKDEVKRSVLFDHRTRFLA
jgi:hypothetical protein